jgi:cysteine desulfurase
MVTPPVYMDYHATTPVDHRVLEAMMPFFTQHFGNTASVQHRFGWIAKEAVEIARKNVANAIGAQPKEIIFTGSATESNNLAVKGAAEAYRSKGNHIITTQIEHACVLESCRMLERNGFTVTYLPVDRYGMVSIDAVTKAVTEQTILISVMSANNEIGTIQPVKAIGDLCRERNIIFHTDATQAVGKMPLDVDALGIHLLSMTSHKIYGPKGIGALYIRSKDPRISVETQMHGAGHEHGLRSGTLNVPGIVGFGTAIRVSVDAMEEENNRVRSMRDRLQDRLLAIPGITVNGHPLDRLPNNLSITVKDVHADLLMTAMSDIAVSAGSACTSHDIGDIQYSHVLRAVGLDAEAGRSTIRIGLGRFTTEQEIDTAADRFTETIALVRERTLAGVV